MLVIDEFPSLIETTPAIEAILQKQWDRSLESQPVLLILVGSIKWCETAPLDDRDVTRLIAHRELLPGASASTKLVGVSRTGFATDRLDVELSAEDILAAGTS